MRTTARFIVTLALCYAGAATAQPEAGNEYRVLSEPQGSKAGKTQVIEFFSYGCPHCHSFHPLIKDWQANAGDDVEVIHVPVTFGQQKWEILARAYYVAKSLGVTDKTHGAVFEAIHVKGQRFRSREQIADLYASVGVDREDVMDAFDSFVVDMKMKRAKKMARNYQVQRTPSMAVAGRYVTDPNSAGGQEAMLSVVDYLLDNKVGNKGTGQSSAKNASGGSSQSSDG